MRVITISDVKDNLLAFDLIDLLRELGPRLVDTNWELEGIDCTGEGAEELHQLGDGRVRVPGAVLLSIAARICQVIDGNFRGYRDGHSPPWITICAVDSSCFEVITDDDSLIEQLKRRFKAVSEIPIDQYSGPGFQP